MKALSAALGARWLGALILLTGLSLAAHAEPSPPLSENQKIERLISAVEQLHDAVFIRNGQAYDGKAAAAHMRTKWRWKSGEIKTARDFIRIAASTSSESGLPYLIRWKDGREIKSAEFLGEKLDRIEGKPAKK